MRLTPYFIITFLFACQHNPSNVQIVYKNSKGIGYQPSGFKLLDEEDYTPHSKKNTEEVIQVKKKSTAELTPFEVTDEATETIKNDTPANSKSTSLESTKENYHVVQKGETYYSVARLYFLDPKNLMQWNGAKEGEKLHPATIIRLYGEGGSNASGAALPAATSAKTSSNASLGAKPLQISSTSKQEAVVPSAKNLEIKKDAKTKQAPVNHPKNQLQPEAKQVASSGKSTKCGESFIMPVTGLNIETGFGDTYKSGVKSDGIIFEAKIAQNVKAANSGEVAYVGDGFSDYGNIVIIRHNNSYFSIYGHLANTSVKRGQAVKNGEVIASTNPIERKFYFSIRKGKTPIDPLSCIKK